MKVAWIGLLAGVVLAAAAGVVVGFHVPDHGAFNWGLASAVGTATGTMLLASVTGALAIVTTGDVRASREIAESARGEQRARERPIVVISGVTVNDVTREGTVVVDFNIRNIGQGVAIRGEVGWFLLDTERRRTVEVDSDEVFVGSLLSGEPTTHRATIKGLKRTPLRTELGVKGVFYDANAERWAMLNGQVESLDDQVRVFMDTYGKHSMRQ